MPNLLESCGNIIKIASIGGTDGSRSGVAYTTPTHGLVAMTCHTAFSYAKRRPELHAVCPDRVETTTIRSAMELRDAYIDRDGAPWCNSRMRSLPCIGEPEEISNIACLLASSEASLLNGAVVVADVGWTP